MSKPADTQPMAPAQEPLIIRGPQTQDLYAEGLSQVTMGYPLVRITLHNAVELPTADSPEKRHIAFTLTMPTHGLLDLCLTMLRIYADNESKIVETSGLAKSQLESLLASIPDRG